MHWLFGGKTKITCARIGAQIGGVAYPALFICLVLGHLFSVVGFKKALKRLFLGLGFEKVWKKL